MNVVTRFAPSPTGMLHIGGVRTALFNYLFSRRYKGKFFLRIEDTDRARYASGANKAILDGLQWLGLEWDDEIYYQSEHSYQHKAIVTKLINSGKAYYCNTSVYELQQLREKSFLNKDTFIFRGKNRENKEYIEDSVVRFKVPLGEKVVLDDGVQGKIEVNTADIEDFVLLRSDFSPTYMLCVVVDDYDLGITHIIRGDDHITNSFKQILIYKALGWQIPEMYHIPLIYGPDGKKLSKRHGALGIDFYKDQGYFPEALLTYLLRLGWGNGDEELSSIIRAKEVFSLEGLRKSPARIDFEKMRHVNHSYLKNVDNDCLLDQVLYNLSSDYNVSDQSKVFIYQAMDEIKKRSSTLLDLTNLSKIYLVDYMIVIPKNLLNIVDKRIIDYAVEVLEKQEDFSKQAIQVIFKELSMKIEVKLGELMKHIRILLTGMENSPSVFEIISIIGKENTIKRLNQCSN